VSEVRGYFDAGDGDHADARILQLGAQQPGQLALDLIGDSPQPLLVGHETAKAATAASDLAA
jgi:hypothetical protein